jgi:hypothetical protein
MSVEEIYLKFKQRREQMSHFNIEKESNIKNQVKMLKIKRKNRRGKYCLHCTRW